MLTVETILKVAALREDPHHFGDACAPVLRPHFIIEPSKPGDTVRRWNEEKGCYEHVVKR